MICYFLFFFSSRRRHTRCLSDWSSDVCSSDLEIIDVFLHRPFLPFNRFDESKLSAAAVEVMTRAMDAEIGIAAKKIRKIGRASCRERVEISVGTGALKKKKR